jgi:pyruvate/2-oxoglutarate dehydrogenase complex dihydrolipoamide acyltransferase (E2) component
LSNCSCNICLCGAKRRHAAFDWHQTLIQRNEIESLIQDQEQSGSFHQSMNSNQQDSTNQQDENDEKQAITSTIVAATAQNDDKLNVETKCRITTSSSSLSSQQNPKAILNSEQTDRQTGDNAIQNEDESQLDRETETQPDKKSQDDFESRPNVRTNLTNDDIDTAAAATMPKNDVTIDAIENMKSEETNASAATNAQNKLATQARTVSSNRNNNSNSTNRVGNWLILRKIGQGSFASVFAAKHITTGELCAIKSISKNRLSRNAKHVENLDSEIKIMKSINHPHIVGLIDILKTQNHIYLIMEAS